MTEIEKKLRNLRATAFEFVYGVIVTMGSFIVALYYLYHDDTQRAIFWILVAIFYRLYLNSLKSET